MTPKTKVNLRTSSLYMTVFMLQREDRYFYNNIVGRYLDLFYE